MPEAIQTSMPVVDTDLCCRHCQYNLRSLPTGGRCPECGTPVELSLHGDLLRFADPAWLDQLRLGVNLLFVSISCLLLHSIAVEWTRKLLSFISARQLLQILTVLGAASMILLCLGGWLLTTRDPSGLEGAQDIASRRLIRFTLVIALVERVLQSIPQWTRLSYGVYRIDRQVYVLCWIIVVIGLLAQQRYLARLALRIPNISLNARANVLIYAIGIPFAVVETVQVVTVVFGANSAWRAMRAVAVLAEVVFGCAYLLMLRQYSRAFRQQACEARALWNNGRQV